VINLKEQTDTWLIQALIHNSEEFERLATTPDVHPDEFDSLREWLDEIDDEIQRRKILRELNRPEETE
jgi:hypothetical protein